MRPIIVTLPRTGSTLITELLGSIAMEHYGYKNILQEYFSINVLYRQIFERNSDDVIGFVNTADSGNELAQMLGYNNATGNLEFSSLIDGGQY